MLYRNSVDEEDLAPVKGARKRKQIERWVAALRSRKYKPGQSSLKEGDEYCCLGVYCETLRITGITEIIEGKSMPDSVGLADKFPISNDAQQALATLNDAILLRNGKVYRKHSFEKIASIIEATWLS